MMNRHTVWMLAGACLTAALALALSAHPAKAQMDLYTEPSVFIDQVADTATFSQVIYPPTDDEARVARRQPLIGTVTLTGEQFADGYENHKSRFEGIFTSEQITLIKSQAFERFHAADLMIADGEFWFELKLDTGVTEDDQSDWELNAETISKLLPLLTDEDTPLTLSTLIADDELVTTLGLAAWLKERRVSKAFTLRSNVSKTYSGVSWRFSRYGDGKDDIVIEVVQELTKEQTAEVLDIITTRSDPGLGLSAGYSLSGNEQPLYLGACYHVAGRVSLTAGAMFGGGEGADLAFGVSFDVFDIIDEVTSVMEGGEEPVPATE